MSRADKMQSFSDRHRLQWEGFDDVPIDLIVVTFPSSTRNLSWSLSVVMRTSSSQQPIRTGAVPTVLKFEILTL